MAKMEASNASGLQHFVSIVWMTKNKKWQQKQ
jgi:hypothetical protein